MMEVVRLPVGKQAPVDADCIRIEQIDDISYKLTASALCSGVDDDESVSIVDTPVFQRFADAETAGLAWAEDVGVEKLFVSTGTLAHPLEQIEIDRSL